MEPKIQSTSWNPEIEKAILKKWEEQDVYRFAINDNPSFVILRLHTLPVALGTLARPRTTRRST